MRLYSAKIEDFYNHVRGNTLADTIRDNFKAHLGRYPGVPEYNSFNPNSAGIPREAGGGPSAMRARPDGANASRRAPAMRAEIFSRSFQANLDVFEPAVSKDNAYDVVLVETTAK